MIHIISIKVYYFPMKNFQVYKHCKELVFMQGNGIIFWSRILKWQVKKVIKDPKYENPARNFQGIIKNFPVIRGTW